MSSLNLNWLLEPNGCTFEVEVIDSINLTF